jgi:hypothetical protein
MDEDVIAIFALDKAKTLSRVKPLYGSCFFHVSSIPMISGFLSYRFEYRAEATLDLTSTSKRSKNDERGSQERFSLACLSPPSSRWIAARTGCVLWYFAHAMLPVA